MNKTLFVSKVYQVFNMEVVNLLYAITNQHLEYFFPLVPIPPFIYCFEKQKKKIRNSKINSKYVILFIIK